MPDIYGRRQKKSRHFCEVNPTNQSEMRDREGNGPISSDANLHQAVITIYQEDQRRNPNEVQFFCTNRGGD